MPADEPLPPYTYVPGQSPHPISDPQGHAYGEHPQPATVQQSEWWLSPAYRQGERLFLAGYYWEAHEAWESLWHALGRTGPAAAHCKGLIKLAACGVKCLEGNAAGAERHARRALELLDSGESTPDREAWIQLARHLVQARPVCDPPASGRTPQPLPGFTPDRQRGELRSSQVRRNPPPLDD
ncbi:MAG: DUF309 domain-containing protein [Planctomycetaceae bacterium]|nr:DUF309 domain-containing protein [Planctomycetaceae bacterium]